MITIKLTEEQMEQLIEELTDGVCYRWNSDSVHAKDCPSKILSEIEKQLLDQTAPEC